MIAFEIDYTEVEKFALSVGAAVDQIPFAMALAMNRSADITRNLLIQATWPQHVKQRNSSFIAASLTTKDSRASKQSLSVEIYDRLNRGHLQAQAVGGVATPRSTNLAVPAARVARTRGARGVPQRLRPWNMPTGFRQGDVLYTRVSKGSGRGRLQLMYVLKRQTPVPKRVPFYEDFAASMSRELQRTLPLAVAHAMATRR